MSLTHSLISFSWYLRLVYSVALYNASGSHSANLERIANCCRQATVFECMRQTLIRVIFNILLSVHFLRSSVCHVDDSWPNGKKQIHRVFSVGHCDSICHRMISIQSLSLVDNRETTQLSFAFLPIDITHFGRSVYSNIVQPLIFIRLRPITKHAARMSVKRLQNIK